MKHLPNGCKTLAMSAFALAAAFAVAGGVPSAEMLPQALVQTQHSREFRGQKPFDINTFNAREGVSGPRRAAATDPSLSFEEMPRYDYLQGPDGSTWFYTVDYDFETVVHNPWWSEDMITGFTFTIYDNLFNEVGTIKDKISFAANETRAREILLDAAVTKHFYNTDDRLEVMVYHVMNTEEYRNHYYYKIYTIDGEKDTNGNDVSIATFEGRCGDAINAGTPENEDFYITFITDPVVDFDGDTKSQAYIDYLNTLTYDLTTYGKATDAEGPKEVLSKSIYLTRVPGDTTSGIYMISKKVGNQLYLVFSEYDKPYFVEPVVVTGDESATPNNSFVIETYALSATGGEKVCTTTIPVDYPDSSQALCYAYYSIGSVAWSNDIDMSVNGTPTAPAFIVARDIETVATEDVLSNYEIYNASGTKVRVIATGAETIDVYETGGAQPQVMFVTPTEDGSYTMLFANLYDGQELFSISQDNDGDPLVAACSLVKDGEGNVNYAFEMRRFETDDNGNSIHRVAWFDNEGKPLRVDRINMGKNVQAAMINLDPAGLHPDIYDTDEDMEYAVLVKRTYGSAATTRNEFMVVDHTGDVYALFTADDERGEPAQFTVLPGTPNRIMMVYQTYYGYNIDLYDLPFEKAIQGVADAIGNDDNFAYDGTAVYAPGSAIAVYAVSGHKVAEGRDVVAVDTLAPGVYVVTTGDATHKIVR